MLDFRNLDIAGAFHNCIWSFLDLYQEGLYYLYTLEDKTFANSIEEIDTLLELTSISFCARARQTDTELLV